MNATASAVKTIFGQALEMSTPAERVAYVEQACAENVALRRDVLELLHAWDGAGDFLQASPALRYVDERPPAAEPESSGDLVGPYRLLEPIGEGGMGVVYLAEQQQPVQRRVALKIIKPGMDTRQVVARFEAERQVLALMEHPYIARILDGGATESGRPYFVMDWAPGQPITTFADEHHLPTAQRLELMITVCQAVQHAHHKGIIHRDLKPSNILVTTQDGRPTPKIIDFGIAKAISPQGSESLTATGLGQLVGTPQYMSPEQTEPGGRDVDTRSDVYSLGVVLYELLTGTAPLEAARLRDATFDDLRQMIRDEEPPRPSDRLDTLNNAGATTAEARGCEPRQLVRTLRGELDWITMKALEKNRTRRYDSPADLARDLERYLRNEPVLAGPPSWSYRARKLLRRHRGPVAAGLLVLLTLVGGIVGTTVGLLRSLHAERTATQERIAAENAQQAESAAHSRTRSALDLLTDRLIGRAMLRQRQSSVEEQRFLQEIEKHYQDWVDAEGDSATSREHQANGYRRVAQIRLQLGDLAGAETNCRQAIELYHALLEGAPTNADYRRELARTHGDRGDIEFELGRHEAAVAAYEAALSRWNELFARQAATPAEKREVAWTQAFLGRTLRATGRPQRAEAVLRGIVAELDRRGAPPTNLDERRLRADGLDELARALVAQDRLVEAEETYRVALAEWDRLIADFPQDADARRGREATQGGIAQRLAARGDFGSAEALWREIVAARRKPASESPGDPNLQAMLAHRLLMLGELLRLRGRPADAERILGESVDIYSRLVDGPHATPMRRQYVARSLAELSASYAAQQRWQEARETVDRAQAAIDQALLASPRNRRFEQTLQRVLDVQIGVSLQRGDHAEAAARATQLAALRIASPRTINASAWGLAQCAWSAAHDPALALDEKWQQINAYIQRGLDLTLQAAVRELTWELYGHNYWLTDAAEAE